MIIMILILVTWLVFLTMFTIYAFSDVKDNFLNQKRRIDRIQDKSRIQEIKLDKIEQELNGTEDNETTNE